MNIGIIVNETKTHVFPRLEELIQWLNERDCPVFIEEDVSYPFEADARAVSRVRMAEQCEVVVVFGGDGTLLHASHLMARFNTPILGVNSGGLGFLTETTLDEMFGSMRRILDRDFEVQHRMMLSGGKVDSDQSVIHCLNDLVLSRAKHGRVINVAAYVDGDYVTNYVCDGIIVSTPTGSTAYNLSANGPIVHPELESMILNPICPHTLTNRPLILSPHSVVRLQVETRDECILTADGQDQLSGLKRNDEVMIEQSDREVMLIKPEDRDYFSILRTKLHWGGKTSS